MTKSVVRVVFSCALLAAVASPAAGQDVRRLGLTFAFPGAVGVQWDVTDMFSLRADAGFNRSRSEFTTDISDFIPRGQVISWPSPTTITTSQYVSIGVSAMWAIHARDQLKVYVAPRIGVRFASQETETEYDLSGLPPAIVAALQLPSLDEDFSESDAEPEFGAMFGVSYRVAERFGVFAETGVEYTRGDFESRGVLRSTHSSFGLRSGVGGVLYF